MTKEVFTPTVNMALFSLCLAFNAYLMGIVLWGKEEYDLFLSKIMWITAGVSVGIAIGIFANVGANAAPETPRFHEKISTTNLAVLSQDRDGKKYITYTYDGKTYTVPLEGK